MHIVRAFVRVDHVQVQQVARDAELVGDAVASHHVARDAGDVEHLDAVVALEDTRRLIRSGDQQNDGGPDDDAPSAQSAFVILGFPLSVVSSAIP